MTSKVSYEYIANYFCKWLDEHGIKFPVVLFLDGHKSHLSYHLCKFCKEKGIILVALCPNATHIIQPLHVAVFKPFKQNWSQAVHQWKTTPENFGKTLTKFNFSPLLQQAMNESLKRETIRNGFRKCGIVPWNANAVDYSKTSIIHAELTSSCASSSNDDSGKKSSSEKIPKLIDMLESLINPDTLVQFKKTYSKITPIWMGDQSAHDLYVVWKHALDSSVVANEHIDQ